MNINTNHLVTNERFQAMQELQREEYTPVPKELEPAAAKKLAGKPEAMVSLTSGGKLSNWAGAQRKKNRKSAKEKMVKESRRRNRRR